MARRLDAVAPGHVNVHQNDVRLKFLGFFEGLLAVIGLIDNAKFLFLLEKSCQPGPEKGMVVNE